jgi:hypothetical protein
VGKAVNNEDTDMKDIVSLADSMWNGYVDACKPGMVSATEPRGIQPTPHGLYQYIEQSIDNEFGDMLMISRTEMANKLFAEVKQDFYDYLSSLDDDQKWWLRKAA